MYFTGREISLARVKYRRFRKVYLSEGFTTMRVLLCSIAIAALFSSQYASADIIDSVVVNDGTTDITLTAPAGGVLTADPADDFASGSSALLQSFTSGGVTFDSFIAPDSYTGAGGTDVLVPAGSVPAGGTFPTPSAVLTDLDISTGTLGTFGTDGFFDFGTQQAAGLINSDTVFFAFFNETAAPFALVDSTGAVISNTLDNAAQGGEAQLADFDFLRQSGGDLGTDREVFGNTFAVSDFDLNAGSSVADIAGFTGFNSGPDANDGGIAIAAVPEPSSAIVLVSGLGVLLVRRRRK